MRILARLTESKPFKRTYMKKCEGLENDDEIMINRLRLRKYLRELAYN